MWLFRSWKFYGVGAIVALIGAWFLWGSDWLAERRWQAYLREARARGVVFSWAELVSDVVPSKPGGSGERVFGFMQPNAAAGKVLALLPGISGKLKADGRDVRPDWKGIRTALLRTGLQVDPLIADDVRAVYEATSSIQPLVQEIIKTPEIASHFPKLWSDPVFAGLTEINTCRRLMTFALILEIARGQADSARAILDAQLRLGQSLESVPTVWKSVFASAADRDALDGLSYGLEPGLWTDEALRNFGAALIKRNRIRQHVWALATERVHYHECLEQLKSNGQPPSALFGGASGKTWDRVLLQARSSRSSWWRENQLWLQQYYDEEIAEFDADAQQWKPGRPRQFEPDELRGERGKLEAAYLACSQWRFYRTEAVDMHGQLKMGALACALELHRRAKGSYPETLDLLVPTYLPKLPVDPCGGGNFRYGVRDRTGFFLYSIGDNLRDDGGRTEQGKDDKGAPDWWWPNHRRK